MELKIIECPRDAMQGLDTFVPTDVKIKYLDQLLKVGYHTLDCGSFVSPKAIPQMRDTAEVLDSLDMENTATKLSVIVANQRGIDDAVRHERVSYLGYPFSVSEEFQKRNTNRSLDDSLDIVKYLVDHSSVYDKEVVIYISMGFGNPYGEEWNAGIVEEWVGRIAELGVDYFSISDTVGVGDEASISEVFKRLISSYPQLEFGAHFHIRENDWREKVDAAWRNGCKRFDGAIAGFGGCPMAKDELVGNMPTERLIDYFSEQAVPTGLDLEEFIKARDLAAQVFT